MNSTDTRLALPHHNAIDTSVPYAELCLVENPAPRCPVALLLDTSSSMNGEPIAELQRGLEQFYRELAGDSVCRLSVEVCVIGFGYSVSILKPFASLMDDSTLALPVLEASGCTPLGAALDLACHEVNERRKFYKRASLQTYRPWIVTISDGAPNDAWEEPARHVRSLAESQKLVSVGVGIGPIADLATLSTFCSPDLPARQLAGLRFREFFRWLTDSLRSTSGSGDLSRGPKIANPGSAFTPPSYHGSGSQSASRSSYWSMFTNRP